MLYKYFLYQNSKLSKYIKEGDCYFERKQKKPSVLKRLMPYAGNKGYMLYLAMILSAVSGITGLCLWCIFIKL